MQPMETSSGEQAENGLDKLNPQWLKGVFRADELINALTDSGHLAEVRISVTENQKGVTQSDKQRLDQRREAVEKLAEAFKASSDSMNEKALMLQKNLRNPEATQEDIRKNAAEVVSHFYQAADHAAKLPQAAKDYRTSRIAIDPTNMRGFHVNYDAKEALKQLFRDQKKAIQEAKPTVDDIVQRFALRADVERHLRADKTHMLPEPSAQPPHRPEQSASTSQSQDPLNTHGGPAPAVPAQSFGSNVGTPQPSGSAGFSHGEPAGRALFPPRQTIESLLSPNDGTEQQYNPSQRQRRNSEQDDLARRSRQRTRSRSPGL